MSSIEDFIGIDIGTTSIKVSYYDTETHEPKNVMFQDGSPSYPSFYAVSRKTNKEFFGEKALRKISEKFFSVAFEVKRFIGKKFSDESILSEKRRMSDYYTIKCNNDDDSILIEMNGQRYVTPKEFYIKILQQVKDYIRQQGIEANNAIVTVPVTFAQIERQIILDIMRSPEIGFTNVSLTNEPTAAAIDFGFGAENNDFEGMIAIFDYGGGTLDVSIIKITKDENKKPKFDVVMHEGLRDNGGSDIDKLIMKKVMDDIESGIIEVDNVKETLKYLKNKKGQTELKQWAEVIKIYLSRNENYKLELPLDEEGIVCELSQDDLVNSICCEKIYEVVECLAHAIEQAEKSQGEKVKQILMVGGSSQIPLLKTLIEERTGIVPMQSKHPLCAVSRGAAIEGYKMSQDIKINKNERSTYSVGVEVTEYGLQLVKTIIPENEPLPCTKKYDFKVAYDDQECLRVNIYLGMKTLCWEKNKIGCVEMEFGDHHPKANDKVVLFVTMSAEGLLYLKFTLPDFINEQTFEKELQILN